MKPDHYFRFGVFEAHPRGGELRRRGVPVRLPPKTFAFLEALLEKAGQTVSRDELRQRLWPGTHVDFDRGLNNAANRLRCVLRDSARAPRLVQTVPRRGYRFMGPVEVVPYAPPPQARTALGAPRHSPWPRMLAVAATAAVALAAASSAPWRATRPGPRPYL